MEADIWNEWEKFKRHSKSGNYHGPWDQEFGEDGLENWNGDWSKPAKAWDRYACLDGKKSQSELEQEGSGNEKKREKKRKVDNSDKDDAKAKGKEPKESDGHKKLRITTKTSPKRFHDQQDEEYEVKSDELYRDPPVIPKKSKDQVAEIVQFLGKAHLLKLPTTPEKLTDKIKTKLREETPSSEDCRLNVYWKRPAVGIHLKAEKRDIGTYALDPDLGTYGLRLAAVLKAASMLVSWNNFIL